MKSYVEIGLESAMLLINHGPVVLVSTKDEKGGYDIAPVAWNCPLGKNPPRLLIVVGKRHRTCENITAAGEFIICVPHVSQAEMVREIKRRSMDDCLWKRRRGKRFIILATRFSLCPRMRFSILDAGLNAGLVNGLTFIIDLP